MTLPNSTKTISALDRRGFLKALGVGTGASALSACGLDDNRYYTPVETVLPYVTRPEQLVPGTPTFFATSVGTGPHAWPALATNREGRLINVGANRMAPVAPGVSRFSIFEVQRHYSPDRFRGPLAGGPNGQAATWEKALAQLADAVTAARGAGKKVAFLGGYRTGPIVDVLRALTAGEAVFWEPLGREADARAAELVFGRRLLPRYDLAEAGYVLSFGADFLGGQWGGQWTQGGYAKARSPAEGGGVARLALVSPHRDQSGANADDWYACIPGSEALVARAVARLVAEKKGYTGPATAWLDGADAATAATAAGLDVAAIEAMAAAFTSGNAIALPGGTAGASAAGTELSAATYLLNVVAGAPGFGLGGYLGPIDGLERLEALIADMKAGKVGVLLVDDGIDPLHALPAEADFAKALAAVDLVVGLSSHPSETGASAKLILPISDVFEDWGDEEPLLGLHVVRQPVSVPLYDSMSLGEIALATWRKVDPTAPQGSWREMVQKHWFEQLFPAVGGAADARWSTLPASAPPMAATAPPAAAPTAAPAAPSQAMLRWWEKCLMDGYFTTPYFGTRLAPEVTGTPIAWSGPAAMAGAGEYHLHAYPHSFLADGRYANQPWAQEVPDPLTGQVWGTWVLVHPDTASKLGVRDNDLLTLTTDKGTVQLGVEVSWAVRADVVAVPFGNGHTEASGRYAKYGANVVNLLGVARDPQGCMAWQQAKVAVTASGQSATLVSTFGNDSDNDRKFVGLVSATALAEKGDVPTVETRHAGAMILDVEEEEWDPRLAKLKVDDFYGTPDHPNYRWGMSIDTNACTGCGACAVACYAENNIPVIGKLKVSEGREMGWLRVDRFWKPERDDQGNTVSMQAYFVPMMCQQCAHAPCESVCPVWATYHTIEGLNAMVYNRCVGTRYCSNACPYQVRRFNYHQYDWPEPFNLQLNPDVSNRTMGVMEKCTFCVQRIRRTKIAWKDHGHMDLVPDELVHRLTACADACPSNAISFGNLNDTNSEVAKLRRSGRAYYPIPEINTFPAVSYLGRATHHRGPAAEGDKAKEGAASHTDPPAEPATTEG